MQKETKHPGTRQLARTVKANTVQVQNKMAKSSSGEMQGWHKQDVGGEILTRPSIRPPLGGPPYERNISGRTGENQRRHIIY